MPENRSASSSELNPGEASSAAIPQEEVRAELQRILLSPEFRGSKRCQDFLRFVVEETLQGLPNGLKERTIGIGVFGRVVTYNTNEDGTVRIKASEVRKRLTLYYAGSGKDAALFIELPVGTYVPVFSRVHTGALENKPAPIEDAAEPTMNELASRKHRFTWPLLILGALAILVISWFEFHHSPSMLDQFWEPVLHSSSPVLVAAAYAPVYVPRQPNRDSSQPTPPADFIQLDDQYVGGGDLVAAARISGMLGRMGHAYNVRMGSTITFEDLRDSPSVLIGYSSTQWAQVTKDFRFFIDDNNLGMIKDFGKPTDWYPHLTPERHTDEDYAIISRAFNPQTHSILVLVTGSTQYGTEAAANLITSPDLLADALHGAPKGWQQKNLQWVLDIRVIANSPASPKVIASYYW